MRRTPRARCRRISTPKATGGAHRRFRRGPKPSHQCRHNASARAGTARTTIAARLKKYEQARRSAPVPNAQAPSESAADCPRMPLLHQHSAPIPLPEARVTAGGCAASTSAGRPIQGSARRQKVQVVVCRVDLPASAMRCSNWRLDLRKRQNQRRARARRWTTRRRGRRRRVAATWTRSDSALTSALDLRKCILRNDCMPVLQVALKRVGQHLMRHGN